MARPPVADATDRVALRKPLSVKRPESVNLAVRVWTKSTDYFATKLALTENIKLAFDEANITIPYPQIQVHTTNSKLADSDRLG